MTANIIPANHRQYAAISIQHSFLFHPPPLFTNDIPL